MDLDRKTVLFRIDPVGQCSVRTKPMDLAVRVELFLAQNGMGSMKGGHAMRDAENIPAPF